MNLALFYVVVNYSRCWDLRNALIEQNIHLNKSTISLHLPKRQSTKFIWMNDIDLLTGK